MHDPEQFLNDRGWQFGQKDGRGRVIAFTKDKAMACLQFGGVWFGGDDGGLTHTVEELQAFTELASRTIDGWTVGFDLEDDGAGGTRQIWGVRGPAPFGGLRCMDEGQANRVCDDINRLMNRCPAK